ncbi:putative Ig domain-containing protein [Candidatus Jorgensenbacteria bacterium]|nr:putative Ig domain-containing protein [Candidatus Jorgensenbacteria bacterium]
MRRLVFIKLLLVVMIGSLLLSYGFVEAAVQNNTQPSNRIIQSFLTAQLSSVAKNLYEQFRSIFGVLQNALQDQPEPSTRLSGPQVPPQPTAEPSSLEGNANEDSPEAGKLIKEPVFADRSTNIQAISNRILDLNEQFVGQSGPVSQKTLLTMVDLAKKRKTAILEALNENPLYALVSFLPGTVISKLPIQVQNEIPEREVVLKGSFRIVPPGTAGNKTSKVKYIIEAGDKKKEFDPFGLLPKINSGATVKIEGYQLGEDRVVALVDKNTFQIIAGETVSVSTPGVQGSDVPVITSVIGPTSIRTGEAGTWLVKAYQGSGVPLRYSIEWGDGLIDGPSGASEFTRAFTSSGIRNVTVRVTSGVQVAIETFKLNVIDVAVRQDRAPRLANIANKTVQPGDLVFFTIAAVDPDGDPLIYSVQDTSGLPGASFDTQARTFRWLVPGNQSAGNYSVSFRVSDGEIEDEEEVLITVSGLGSAVGNRTPFFDEIPDQSVRAGGRVEFMVVANDLDHDQLSYSTEGSLPVGASFDSDSGKFVWNVLRSTQPGVYNANFSVSDGKAIEAVTVFIEVTAPSQENRPPVFSSLMETNLKVNEGNPLTFYLLAFDPDVSDALAYGVSRLPANANLDDSTGVFTWTPSFDQAGVYTVTFTVSDGRLSALLPVTIAVDNVNRAPSLQPIGNKRVSAKSRLLFHVSAIDPDGDPVVFSALNVPGGATFDATTGYFSWIPTTVGNYTIAMTAADRPTTGGGSLSDSESIIITVQEAPDLTPPTVSMISPIDGASVSGTIVVAATSSDDIGVVGVQFKLDGQNLGLEDTSAPWAVQWNTASSSNNIHTLTASARDGAGKNTTSTEVVVNVLNDRTAPTVSVAFPTAGAVVSGDTQLRVNTSDDISGVLKVYYELDGGSTCCVSESAPFSYSLNTRTLTNGGHTVRARAQDNAGNIGVSPSVSFTVNNDTTPPTVTITRSPANPLSNQTVTFTATANDSNGIYEINIWVDQTPGALTPIWRCPGVTTCVYAGGPYIAGQHTYAATAKDNSPLRLQGQDPSVPGSSYSFTVQNYVPPDTTPPVVSVIHSPVSPYNNQTVTFTATATDASGISNISIFVDNSLIHTCTATSICSKLGGPYSAGSHSYYATARDASPQLNQGRNPSGVGTTPFTVQAVPVYLTPYSSPYPSPNATPNTN